MEQTLKANELRIGNLLLNPYSNEPEVVYKIGPSTALNTKWEVNEEHPDFFRLIPLTEQWLKDFGLQKKGPYKWDHDLLCNYLMAYPSGNTMDGVAYEIKYVHQLQNLYFAITGTELELKTEPKTV